MSARSALPAALFLATCVVSAAAQEVPPVIQHEEAAPAPQVAVERPARDAREPGERVVRAPRDREVAATQEARPRSRPVLAAAATPAAVPAEPAAAEEQGGRRRPDAGSRGGGGRSAGGGGGARPRGGVRAPDNGGGRGGRGGWDDDRDSGGNWGPQAVPRRNAPRPQGGYATYSRRYYAGAGGLGYYVYDPWSWYAGSYWGYGAYGAWNGFYGNNAWGPWGGGFYGGGFGVYGGPYGWSIGGVRLRVNPKDAEVYVDGYYAGIVDDFDGMWQQLRLDDGGYRIEIRKPGMTTLTFDVRVQPGRTITYRGVMNPGP